MPKRDLQKRIDLRPGGFGSRGTLSNVSSHGQPFDDTPYLRRDGSRSLYGTARWVWELGAEVAGTLRSWGDGILQIFGALYVGRAEGPSAGLWEMADDDGNASAVFQVKDNANVPFIGFGAVDSTDVNDIWGNVGYEGYPRIYFGFKDPYERQIPLVATELLDGQIYIDNIDLTELAGNFPMPVVTSLDGLYFQEGQQFLLRLGADSGAVYVWTRWGPEPVGGYHRAGPHNHASAEEGEQLLLATSFLDVHITAPVQADALVYDGTGEYWYNGDVTAARVALADIGGYFVETNVESGMEYLIVTLNAGGPSGTPDASVVTYTPVVATDWDSNADPGNVDNALDQLAERVDDLEGATPGGGDAADITYTPAVLANWDSSADPGDVDGALDQLAERVNAMEIAIGGRTLISEQTPTGTGTVTFNSISGGYKNLLLEWVARSTRASGATDDTAQIRFNGDTTATNYRRTRIYSLNVPATADDGRVAYVSAASSPAGSCGQGWLRIIQYAGTTFRKQVKSLFTYRQDDAASYEVEASCAVEWENTAAITQIDLILDNGNWDTGSTFRLYGEN